MAKQGDAALSTRYWAEVVRAQALAGMGDLDGCQRALDAAEGVRELTGKAHNDGWLRFDIGRRLLHLQRSLAALPADPPHPSSHQPDHSGDGCVDPRLAIRRPFLHTDPGRVFREAWIAGVRRYFPGEPKPGYVVPWEHTPGWERDAAAAVYHQVRTFVETTGGGTSKLNRAQKGRFVAICWIGQIYKHFPDPKPSYGADWDELPDWQQETDADIFERIERDVRLL